MLIWETKQFIYIEHFAICKHLRGQDYGTKSMLLLMKTHSKQIILEIEPPDKNDDVTIKRLRFYENLGYVLSDVHHLNLPYQDGDEGRCLKIMSNSEISTSEYDVFNTYYKTVVKSFI